MVELEESAMFPIGLGRVDVIDTELTVDVVITGCSSTEESSLAMPGIDWSCNIATLCTFIIIV